MSMEMSRLTSKGQVTVPKAVRQKLNLREGDRVVFIEEDGKMVITKASVIAFQNLKEIEEEARRQGLTEEDLMNDVKRVRKEMWNERGR